MIGAENVAEFCNHPYPCHVFFPPDEGAWDALMDSFGADDEAPEFAASVTTFDDQNGHECFVIWIGPKAETANPVQVMGLMAHEIVHVIQRITECIRVERLDTETEAYLMQSMLEWLIGAFADAGRKAAAE